MNLPEFHLPDFSGINFGGVGDFIKRHLIPIAIGAVVIVGGIVGGKMYLDHKKAEEARIAAESIDWSIKPLTLDQLEGGNYYVKDGETYYKVAPGLLLSTPNGEAATIPSMADPVNRMVMFGQDDQQIPTLYKDTKLIYKASDFNNPGPDGTVGQTPTEYVLERFSDQGYSIGVCRLENPDGTKYRTAIVKDHFYPTSNAISVLKLKPDAELIVDKINGVPINASNVSQSGTITGLTHNATYTLDAYIGTSPVGGQIIADTHMFTSFELYTLKDYELDAAGYAVIKMPEDLWSGYYYINGMGLFRYVNGFKAYGVSADTDYNVAYYKGKDQAGNLITNPAPSITDPNADTVVGGTGTATGTGTGTISAAGGMQADTSSADPFTYHHKLTIDNQQKAMKVVIEYTEAMTYSDTNSDGTYEVLKASDGILIPGASIPAATLTSPSGKKYTMTNMGAIEQSTTASLNDMVNQQSETPQAADTEETQRPNTLSATIDNPEVGTWNIDITGIYGRAFTINSTYEGSNTNMVIKNTSDATAMTVYLPEGLFDAVFKFTWDELGHTGTFTVVGPAGNEIVSNARDGSEYRYPDSILLEQYGEVDLHVGPAEAGEYKIQITGESLGHVYWNCLDLANGDSSVGKEDAAAESSTEEVVEEKPAEEVKEEPAPVPDAAAEETSIHEK